VALATGTGRAAFASADVPKAIADDDPTSVSAVSTLSVPAGGLIDHLTVTVNAAHAYVGDLRARLTAPSGQTVDLLERPGRSDDGFGAARTWNGPLTFDDDAATPIQEIARTGATLGGAFVPDEPLAALAGQSSTGTWTLRMTDEASPDAGTLNGWSVATEQPTCTIPPLPPSGGGTPPVAQPPAARRRPAPSLLRLTRAARLDRRGRFVLAFATTPNLHGRVGFRIPRRGRHAAIVFGRRPFAVPANGPARIRTTVRGAALRRLRALRTSSVTLTLVLDGTTFRRRLTLTAPAARPPRRR
jgi:subtilisin-like proprotein convertase family protein